MKTTMTVLDLIQKLSALPVADQHLPVYRGDVDFGPVAVSEVEVVDLIAYSEDDDPHVNYFPEVQPEDGEVTSKGVQIR